MKAWFPGPARAGTLAAATILAASVLLGVGSAPLPARGVGPLPACRYDDILTSPRGYNDWPVTLVDTILRVSANYVPPDLVDVSQADIPGGGQVRAILIDDLREMAAAARAAGAPLAVQSAYRSYQTQREVFAGWVAFHGRQRALQLSARPGHSEHQLGIGIDFKSEGGGSPFDGEWQHTEQGKWMKAHAWEYGFVMSYPRGSLDVTCYDFEPWHFRYVGREVAAAIHGSGQTPREYLWANYTTTVVPARTAKPDKPARPTETPPSTVEPSVAPSLEPTSEPVRPTPTVEPATLAPTESAVVAPSEPPEATPPPVVAPIGSVSDVLKNPAVLAALAIAAAALLLALVVVGWKVLRGRRSALGL